MPEKIYAYKNGSFKEVKFVHIKQSNVWKLVNQIYIRTGNAWKRSYVAWVASGGTEATYNGYKYHIFTGNGTFTAAGFRSCELLLIGGGGGGGNSVGGAGGGGGGLQNYISVDLYTGTYNITVGVGGGAQVAGGISSIVLNSQVIKTVTGGGAGGSGVGASRGGDGGASNSRAGGSGQAWYVARSNGDSGQYGYVGGGGSGSSGAGGAGNAPNQTVGGGGGGTVLSPVEIFSTTSHAAGGSGARSGYGGVGTSCIRKIKCSNNNCAEYAYGYGGVDNAEGVSAGGYGGGGKGSVSAGGAGTNGIVVIRYLPLT
jgi:hypothetical protein